MTFDEILATTSGVLRGAPDAAVALLVAMSAWPLLLAGALARLWLRAWRAERAMDGLGARAERLRRRLWGA